MALAVAAALAVSGGCRLVSRRPALVSEPAQEPVSVAADTTQSGQSGEEAGRAGAAERDTLAVDASRRPDSLASEAAPPPDRDSIPRADSIMAQVAPPPDRGEPVSPEIAAIIASIEAGVRDSIAAIAAEQDSALAATDSLALVMAQPDTVLASTDSLALVMAEPDSALAAADSLPAVAVEQDSIWTAADSLPVVMAEADSALAATDSLATVAAEQDSMLAATDSIASVSAQPDSALAVGDSLALGMAEPDSALAGADLLAAEPDSLADGRRDSAAAPPLPTLEQLLADGPSYVAYSQGPRLVWDTEAQATLATTLLPVIRAENIDAETATYYWLLVRADGRVEDAVLHTSSGNAPFDAVAERAARALLFAPATLRDQAIPVWILREISLLMQ